ncbi:MAG: SIMPL domain-containing protein [bacterium]
MSILLILSLIAQCGSGVCTSNPGITISTPALSVTGQGSAVLGVQATEYKIILYADAYASEENKALDTSEKIREEIIDATKKIGGKKKDVVLTSRNTMEPIEGDPYYRVEQDIQISLKDVKDINKIKETYLLIDGVQVGSCTPVISRTANYNPAIKKARANALKNAKEEAQALAADMEVMLGEPIFISENITYPTYAGYETSEEAEIIVSVVIYYAMTYKK